MDFQQKKSFKVYEYSDMKQFMMASNNLCITAAAE